MIKRGYVLFMTMAMLALATTIVTQLFFTGSLYNAYAKAQLQREQAKRLALSGVACAFSQLSLQDQRFATDEKEDKKNDKQKKDKSFYKKQLFKLLLNVQYRWQSFDLTYAYDGIDATIQFCIMPEDGKIAVNSLYNYKTHSFFASFRNQQQTKMYVDFISEKIPFSKIEKKSSDILAGLLKNYKRPLVSITELLKHKACQKFADRLFFIPDYEEEYKAAKEPCFFLADFFTTYHDSCDLNLWTLSPSVKSALGLNPFVYFSSADIKEMSEKIDFGMLGVRRDWDTYLKKIYDKSFDALPKEIIPFLSSKFEPRVFSVLSYAKVGHVGQKLLAILEKDSVKEGEVIKMKKLYWL